MKTCFKARGLGIIMSLLLLISVSLFLSCNKVDLPGSTSSQLSFYSEPIIKVNSNVSGFVTNQNNEPVSGAVVMAGSKSMITGEFGYFEITDADVQANVAVVTVNRSGYFNAIKTYNPGSGNDAFFRIKLISKTNAGNFTAAVGGTVSLHNGLSISFNANSIVNNATGLSYSGTVQVAAFWINPSADDLYQTMPGDLRGMNDEGEMKKLSSYGMAAVELTGSAGEKLQVAPGHTAILTMPMTAEVSANAPATLPLWYFDEAKGLWEEQGSAIRKGNVYVGEVSHFSFWNFDTENSFVNFECTVVNASGYPLHNVLVKISVVNDPVNNTAGYTNAQGYINGAVPSNAVLRLDIMGDEACGGTPVYTQTFTTTNSNISLPLIRVNASAGIASVSGSVKNCYNNPVTNGAVIMQKNGQYYHYPVDKNGPFQFSTIICNSTAEVSLMAYDAASGFYSHATNYTITTALCANINLQACGNSSSQFINYTINGVPYSFTYPASAFAPVTPNNFYSFAVSNELTHEQAAFQFSAPGISRGSGMPLSYFTSSHINGQLSLTAPVLVNITEAGEADEIVAGNFSGTFRGPAPNYTIYNISCSFRVKCQL